MQRGRDAGGAELVRDFLQVGRAVGVLLAPGEVSAGLSEHPVGDHAHAEAAFLEPFDVFVRVPLRNRASAEDEAVAGAQDGVASVPRAARQVEVALKGVHAVEPFPLCVRDEGGTASEEPQQVLRSGREEAPSASALRRRAVDADLRLQAHDRHGGARVPRDVGAGAEVRAVAHREAQELESVDLRAPLVAEVVREHVVRAVRHERHVVARGDHADTQDVVLVCEADLQRVAFPRNPVGVEPHGLGRVEEVHLVVVRTVLAQAREGDAHAGGEALLARRLHHERRGRAAV